MSDFLDSNRGFLPPMPHTVQGISAAAEAANSRPFVLNRMHMVTVGSAPIKVVFAGESGLTNQTTGANVMYLNAGASYTFRSSSDACYMYAAATAGGAFTVSIHQREP